LNVHLQTSEAILKEHSYKYNDDIDVIQTDIDLLNSKVIAAEHQMLEKETI